MAKPIGFSKHFFFFNTLLCVLCRPRPYLYKSDHQYPGVNGTDLPVAVLYAEIGTKEFNTFHKVLSERAQEGKLIYVLRHFVSVSISSVVSLVFVSYANFILIFFFMYYIVHSIYEFIEVCAI